MIIGRGVDAAFSGHFMAVSGALHERDAEEGMPQGLQGTGGGFEGDLCERGKGAVSADG